MTNNTMSKSSVGFSISYAITFIISALLVIFKESIGPLKDFMKALSGHHWVTHGIFTILLFIVLGYFLSKTELNKKFEAEKVSLIIIWATVIGSLLIAGFYLIHWFQ